MTRARRTSVCCSGRSAAEEGKRFASEAILYAFDLLYLNGHDLRPTSCEERRLILEDELLQPPPAIRLSEDVEADGVAFLQQACATGLQGIIAKRRSASYRSGRGGEWLKIKCVQSEELRHRRISAFDRGARRRRTPGAGGSQGQSVGYVGGVGTGFTHASAIALRKLMDERVVLKPAIAMKDRPKSYRWLRPELIAEIEFRAWMDDGKLRHASFKGLRERADEDSVYELNR